jgi:hypothetical protein
MKNEIKAIKNKRNNNFGISILKKPFNNNALGTQKQQKNLVISYKESSQSIKSFNSLREFNNGGKIQNFSLYKKTLNNENSLSKHQNGINHNVQNYSSCYNQNSLYFSSQNNLNSMNTLTSSSFNSNLVTVTNRNQTENDQNLNLLHLRTQRSIENLNSLQTNNNKENYSKKYLDKKKGRSLSFLNIKHKYKELSRKSKNGSINLALKSNIFH